MLDPFLTFQRLYQNEPGSFLLESGIKSEKTGRYSMIGLNPLKIITSNNNLDPFQVLRENLSLKELPYGGVFGFLSYEAAGFIEELKFNQENDLNLPLFYFVIPKDLIIFDHFSDQMKIFSDREDLIRERLKKENLLKEIGRVGQIRSNFNQSDYERVVEKAKEYIKAGDIFQANLAQRFEVDYEGDSLALYKALREINPSPFAAYFNCGDFKIISSSPERLIKLKDGLAETRPIAGTRRRGKDFNEDETLQGALILNEKERAEHLMLLDLERNDLGRVCEYGSVSVDEMMVIEKYSHVMHIVSNVKGRLRDDSDQVDLVRALFPGGTITGCPKIRSMEIIEELEKSVRGPYTGSMGFFSFEGETDLNIIIRTMILKDDKAYFHVGAGIVADSDPKKEYFETLHKAEAMFQSLGVKV